MFTIRFYATQLAQCWNKLPPSTLWFCMNNELRWLQGIRIIHVHASRFAFRSSHVEAFFDRSKKAKTFQDDADSGPDTKCLPEIQYWAFLTTLPLWKSPWIAVRLGSRVSHLFLSSLTDIIVKWIPFRICGCFEKFKLAVTSSFSESSSEISVRRITPLSSAAEHRYLGKDFVSLASSMKLIFKTLSSNDMSWIDCFSIEAARFLQCFRPQGLVGDRWFGNTFPVQLLARPEKMPLFLKTSPLLWKKLVTSSHLLVLEDSREWTPFQVLVSSRPKRLKSTKNLNWPEFCSLLSG